MVIECQSLETANSTSSVMAEKDGFLSCLGSARNSLEAVGIESITTDANVQIRNHMKRNVQDIQHGLDVWHLNKNLVKNLTKKARHVVSTFGVWSI